MGSSARCRDRYAWLLTKVDTSTCDPVLFSVAFEDTPVDNAWRGEKNTNEGVEEQVKTAPRRMMFIV